MRWIRYNSVTGEREEYDDRNPPPPLMYSCPCCCHQTLAEQGGYEICPACFWEDDGQSTSDADVVRSGPNGELSLTQARDNYRSFGACEVSMLKNVRLLTIDEQKG